MNLMKIKKHMERIYGYESIGLPSISAYELLYHGERTIALYITMVSCTMIIFLVYHVFHRSKMTLYVLSTGRSSASRVYRARHRIAKAT